MLQIELLAPGERNGTIEPMMIEPEGEPA